MANKFHRTAVFDQALRIYTHAFYGLLHHFASYTPEELRAMATYAVNEEGQPQLSDKRLVRHIFPLAQRYQQLEGGMRESSVSMLQMLF